jgi:peroxiredoxin
MSAPAPAPAPGGPPEAPPRAVRARLVSINPPAKPGALAPNLSVAGAEVLAVWLEPVPDGHRMQFARWTGAAWTAAATIVESSSIVANWADTPSVVVAGNGALVAHWAERAGDSAYAYHAVAARSMDSGQTWTRLGRLHGDRSATEHGFVSTVADGDGVRAFWLDGRATAKPGGATALRTVLIGETVGPEETIDDRVCDCCGTAAASGATGPAVVYRDRSEDEIRDISIASRSPNGWRSHAVHGDGWRIAGCPVNGPALAARDRHVAVAWYTYADDIHRARVAFSADGGATFGRPVEVDGPRDKRAALGRVDVVLVDDGSAIVSWMASQRDDAIVLVRRVSPSGELGAELAIATTLAGREAGFARMVLVGDDLVFAWTDPRPVSNVRAARMPVADVPKPMATSAAAPPPIPTSPRVGTPAPSVSATTLAGESTSLESLRGRAVLLNVWATWCEPCRQELPELAKLNNALASRGVEIIAVSVDRERNRDEIASFVAKRSLPFQVWLDPEDRISSALGVSTLPATFLIDGGGTIRWRRDGAVHANDRELLGAIDRMLGNN